MKSKVKPILTPLISIDSLTTSNEFTFDSDTDYTNLKIEGLDLSNQVSNYISIEHSLFRKVIISKTKIRKFEIVNTRFDSCDLSNSNWIESSLHRTEILGSKLTGLKLVDSYLHQTLIKNCTGKFSDFRFTKFKAVRFENCDLSEANFQNADLKSAQFINCDLRKTEFSGALLKGTDLRGSKLEGIKVPLENLKGVIVDSYQILDIAKNLATQIGIVIKDDEII